MKTVLALTIGILGIWVPVGFGTDVVINAHQTSLKFYLANGYAEGEWRDAGPVHPGLIRVGKRLE